MSGFVPCIDATFEPQKDITTYELAVIVKNLSVLKGPVRFTKENWDDLDEGIRRHFSRTFESSGHG